LDYLEKLPADTGKRENSDVMSRNVPENQKQCWWKGWPMLPTCRTAPGAGLRKRK